jgi:enterochelin esterase family protein
MIRQQPPQNLSKVRLALLALALVPSIHPSEAQSAGGFEDLQAIVDASNLRTSEAARVIDYAWTRISNRYHTPLIQDDSVVFLYRGKAKSVWFAGDFNAWGRSTAEPHAGTRIGGTDIWMMALGLPSNARADYKLVIDGSEWMVDPNNPWQQYSGVGGGTPNSEIRMPDWHDDPIVEKRAGIPRGQLIRHLTIESTELGYPIAYSLYVPAGYRSGTPCPILYVFDGNEYLNGNLGSMATILDNLIADKRIEPLIGVFIDHRDPADTSKNRRMEELAMDPAYLNFLESDLLPAVEGKYRSDVSQRGVLGTSLGGLAATYAAVSRPQLFTRAGIQSPAYWYRPQIHQLVAGAGLRGLSAVITTGTLHDGQSEAQRMKVGLEEASARVVYIEVPEGHSWGNWKRLIDDILVMLYPAN